MRVVCGLIQLISEGWFLEPPCPRSVDGISIDPEPNWNFASLLSEIESVEKSSMSFQSFLSLSLTQPLRWRIFVMRVSEDEMESDVDEESEEEEEEEHRQLCTKGTLMSLMMSLTLNPSPFLLSKMGLAESGLYEVINDHQTEVKEDIRSQVSIERLALQ
ncbi:hypothetical protein HID58_096147 [Brassica napus]|uniref:Uncharacterized protein n=1 Tax=Brassica napus TaxID=3708 RepID=A0ABQ7X1A6_BRANA|nr:hypothetical protein HID58_096147 [Brassica napus]